MSPAPNPSPTTTRPVPARVIVQLDPAAFGPAVPAGTPVTVADAPVEFRTAADAIVPPLTLVGVERLTAAKGLRLTLASHAPCALRLPPRIDTEDVGPALRLFVDAASYRGLTRGPVRAEWSGGGFTFVSDDAVRPAGFDVADALLPADPREPEAVRLLAEWAVCPEKFRFVDVAAPPDLAAGPVRLDLSFDATALADDWQPTLLLGCVPAVNRRVVELPPVPLRQPGMPVRLDVDPLADNDGSRLVVDVLRARAVRAGRTVTTYAQHLAPLPPSLAVQAARVGQYTLRRHGDQAWLSLADRGSPTGGRTLLVTAACCRRALPDGPVAFAAGARPVTPVRPPVRPAAQVFDADQLLPAVVEAFGGPAVGPVTCRQSPATVQLPAGTADGVELQLTVDLGALSADDAYLLARVLDHAAATVCPIDRFTRLVMATPSGAVIAACPPRAGKVPLVGALNDGLPFRAHGRTPGDLTKPVLRYAEEPGLSASDPGLRRTSDAGLAGLKSGLSDGPAGRAERPLPNVQAERVRSRSAEQRTTVATGFAAVTRPTSVVSLAAVLRHLLGVPVRVVPFRCLLAAVEPDAQLRLGGGGRRLGPRRPTWGVEVVIGPLDRRTFARFTPGTRASRQVRQLLDAAVGPAAVVRPVLRADAVPPWQLGDGRLGRSLWLGRRTTARDFDELATPAG